MHAWQNDGQSQRHGQPRDGRKEKSGKTRASASTLPAMNTTRNTTVTVCERRKSGLPSLRTLSRHGAMAIRKPDCVTRGICRSYFAFAHSERMKAYSMPLQWSRPRVEHKYLSPTRYAVSVSFAR